jgi:hypothetical protein
MGYPLAHMFFSSDNATNIMSVNRSLVRACKDINDITVTVPSTFVELLCSKECNKYLECKWVFSESLQIYQ